jgi:hypothetical protein
VIIDLFCDGHLDAAGTPTHDRWVVARWKGIDGKWVITKRMSEPGEPLRLLKDAGGAELLQGEERVNLREDSLTDTRSRYRFPCGVCGAVLVRKKTPVVEKKIEAILDALAAGGVSELSMRVLTATLK